MSLTPTRKPKPNPSPSPNPSPNPNPNPRPSPSPNPNPNQVPDALAPYCRVRTHVRLRPTDPEDTEIFMLDHSALQFVCINALREAGAQLSAIESSLDAQRTAWQAPNPHPNPNP